MAGEIAYVEIQAGYVKAYDAKRKHLFSQPFDKAKDVLLGYTASSLSTQHGDRVRVYDEKGRCIK